MQNVVLSALCGMVFILGSVFVPSTFYPWLGILCRIVGAGCVFCSGMFLEQYLEERRK